MSLRRGCAVALLPLWLATSACFAEASRDGGPLSGIRVPAGFSIAVYAAVPGARSMTLGDDGTLFVGTRAEGRVYAVVDRDGGHRADQVYVIAQGLQQPNGVAFHDGSLYVAETGRLLRFDRIETQLEHPPAPVVVRADLPNRELHGWKFIAFGPDGMLYVPVGVPCDRCEPRDERLGTIMRMRPDGSGLATVARGIRNTVGFDWQPENGELWFTENGIDPLGENIPPDELNRVSRPGLHFGYPYCHGRSIPDPLFSAEHDCSEFVPAEAELGPHVVPLGMRFYTGRQFPREYLGQVFIAEHGSTNRTEPIGYRVSLVRVEHGRAVGYETFADGWLQGRHASGRPVDVLVARDGALLVSDDQAGAIYRISYRR